jgi:hypothetical protein
MALEIVYGEGQTPISEEERTGLKVKSLSMQHELDEYEQLNIEKGRCIKCNGDSLNFVAKKNNQLQRYDFLPSSRS